jgi:hypothetical protein
MSFRQDLTLNNSFIKESNMGFRDYISRSCELLPNIRNFKIGNCEALRKVGVSSGKKNSVAKKIIAIEALLFQ